MNSTKKKDMLAYFIVGILLVTAISMWMSVSVKSRSREKLLFDNRCYEEAEAVYKDKVSSVLESFGCHNSGLTMTRIVSLEGEREYYIQIYNSKIQKLEKEECWKLKEEISAYKVIAQGGKEFQVTVSFLGKSA